MAAKRRRRRSKADVLGAAVLRDVRAKRRTFLREVSELLSVALGFQVRVSLASPASPDLSPEQRKAARLSKTAARRQVRESAGFGVRHLQVPFEHLPSPAGDDEEPL